jgi:two-component system phosphate regulon sensor histidine kinase PhoR
MAQGDRDNSAARGERRRTMVFVGGGALLVFAVLAAGGALDPATALAAGVAVVGVAAVYGLAAAAGDAEAAARRRTAERDAAAAGGDATGAGTAAADMLEIAPDPILLVGRGGRVITANAAARKAFPLSGESPMLSAFLRDPDVLEAVNAALAGAAEPRAVEFMTMTPGERHLEAFVATVEARGAPDRAMILIHDQTSVKRAERQRVDFLANASHELRTPLASLTGFIETLKGHAREDTAARDRFLSIMEAQAARMRRLIDDLLSLSRVEQNEHVPPKGEVDLVAVARDVADALGLMARERGVRVRVQPAAGEVVVVGDRDQMIQVVQNLAENAIKYTPDGGQVEISVGAGGAPPSAGSIEDADRLAIVESAGSRGAAGWVRVRDHGPGIAPEHMPRLSERFYRVEEHEAGGEKAGTGLGLAIVKHIVARHRGEFAVESAPGEGAAFTVAIPLAGRDDAPAATPSTGA